MCPELTEPLDPDSAGMPPRSRRVTLKDVAESVGVSPSTASLVLSDAPRAEALAPETRDRVLDAARRLGYRPNYLARALRGKRTLSLGVLVPEFSEGYAAGVVSGVDSWTERSGYSTVMVGHHSDSERARSAVRLLEDRGAEGLIVVGYEPEVPRTSTLPTVVIGGRPSTEGVTSVTLDHDEAARLALGHLEELGHRRIAVFRGSPGNVDAVDRWRAIRIAAACRGIEIPDALTLELGSPTYGETFGREGGYREGHAFGRRLLETGEPFTALFAFNDISAIGATRAFLDAGLRVPEDLSVVGFDDLGVASFTNPRLTTIRQPLREMGRIAARILIRWLDADGELGETIAIEPELVVRDSTGPAPVGG